MPWFVLRNTSGHWRRRRRKRNRRLFSGRGDDNARTERPSRWEKMEAYKHTGSHYDRKRKTSLFSHIAKNVAVVPVYLLHQLMCFISTAVEKGLINIKNHIRKTGQIPISYCPESYFAVLSEISRWAPRPRPASLHVCLDGDVPNPQLRHPFCQHAGPAG